MEFVAYFKFIRFTYTNIINLHIVIIIIHNIFIILITISIYNPTEELHGNVCVSYRSGPHQCSNSCISGHALSYGKVLRKGFRFTFLVSWIQVS